MSKKYKEVKKLVDTSKLYELEEAFELAPKVNISKFPGSVELTVNLKLNEKQQKEPLRGNVIFPHSFGETTKILALVNPNNVETAKSAGADYVGLDEFISKIEKGWAEFQVVITTPDVMPKIAKLGKYLGRKGLMPNPKNQTVTTELEKVIKMYKQGKKDFKKDDSDSIKIVIGKTDMTKEQLKANFEEFKKAFKNESSKFGTGFLKSVYLAPTMGPSIKINPIALQ